MKKFKDIFEASSKKTVKSMDDYFLVIKTASGKHKLEQLDGKPFIGSEFEANKITNSKNAEEDELSSPMILWKTVSIRHIDKYLKKLSKDEVSFINKYRSTPLI